MSVHYRKSEGEPTKSGRVGGTKKRRKESGIHREPGFIHRTDGISNKEHKRSLSVKAKIMPEHGNYGRDIPCDSFAVTGGKHGCQSDF